MKQRKDAEEQLAAEVVCSEIARAEGGAVVIERKFDDLSGMTKEERSKAQGRYDFDLASPTQSHALEITKAAAPMLLRDQARWRKAATDELTVIEGLTHPWSVLASQGMNPKELKKLPGWLRTFEAHGVKAAGSNTDTFRQWPYSLVGAAPELREAIVRSGYAGVISCEPAPVGDPGEVFIARAAFGSDYGLTWNPADPCHMVKAANKELESKNNLDNAAKLDRSGRDRRHLWIWIDTSRWDLFRGLNQGVCDHFPNLDPRITDLWFARRSSNIIDMAHWQRAGGVYQSPVVYCGRAKVPDTFAV